MEIRHKLGRVLVVEDEPAICEICRRALVSIGAEVDIAANGSIAQKMIIATKYDLLFIDIRTPEMNGKELYQWLKKERQAMINKVIFTTGDVMGRDTEGFLHEVGRPFLPKPFTPEELQTIVRDTLRLLGKRTVAGYNRSGRPERRVS